MRLIALLLIITLSTWLPTEALRANDDQDSLLNNAEGDSDDSGYGADEGQEDEENQEPGALQSIFNTLTNNTGDDYSSNDMMDEAPKKPSTGHKLKKGLQKAGNKVREGFQSVKGHAKNTHHHVKKKLHRGKEYGKSLYKKQRQRMKSRRMKNRENEDGSD